MEENDLNKEDNSFVVEETLDYVRADLEEEIQMEFQGFLKENGSDIVEQALHEYAEINAIVALDQKGNIIKEFYSFDEIALFFNVKRADNVKNVLAGRQKSAYGYSWKYRKDLNIK